MRRIGRLLLSFNGFLWTLAVAATLYLCVYPLARNLWAYWTWQRVPCMLTREGVFSEESRKYFFKLDGIPYSNDARDFWKDDDIHAARPLGTERLPPNNTICYVSSSGRPGEFPLAVLYLDAHKRLDRAARHLEISILILSAAALITWATRKRRIPAAIEKTPPTTPP